MPAYNAEKYIADSIESVLLQTYKNWELLIVNDGSTDASQDVIDKYVQLDNRIKSFYQKNGKQGKARNLAISHSKGEYLAFLDADDLWLPEKLEIQIEEIKTTNSDLVYSHYYKIHNNDNFYCGIHKIVLGYLRGDSGIIKQIEWNHLPILTVLVKKECVTSVGSFSENLNIANAEDYHLWLKLILNNYVFWGSDKILSAYRFHINSSTAGDRSVSISLLYVYNDLKYRNVKFKKYFKKKIKNILCHKIYESRTKMDIFKLLSISKNSRIINILLLAINLFLPVNLSKKVLSRIIQLT